MSQKTKKNEVRVSLLPGGDISGAQKIPTTKKVLMLVLGVLAFIVLVLFGYLKIQSSRFNTAKLKMQEELVQLDADNQVLEGDFQKYGNLGQRVGFAKSVLDQHIAPEQVLEILSASAIPEVTLNQIAADTAGSIALTGRGAGFNAVSRQVLAWRAHEKIADVRISGISTAVSKTGEIEGIDFNATIILKAKALLWQP